MCSRHPRYCSEANLKLNPIPPPHRELPSGVVSGNAVVQMPTHRRSYSYQHNLLSASPAISAFALRQQNSRYSQWQPNNLRAAIRKHASSSTTPNLVHDVEPCLHCHRLTHSTTDSAPRILVTPPGHADHLRTSRVQLPRHYWQTCCQ